MEKICEFCTASRPVVYCDSDGACLCLSCDAKVHSANTLSSRHLRYLLCDLCNKHPAYVRCLDHRTFMCQRCERKIHDASSQHRKRAISSFMGSPSAKDFAELWGFNLNELAGSAPLHRFVQTTGCSVDPNGLNEDIQGKSNYEVTGPAAASQLSLARGYKIVSSGQQLEMHKSSFILQQLLDLGRLQLSDKNNLSLFLRCQEQDDTMSSTYRTSSILDEKFYPNLQLKETRPEPLSFTHSENFPSFSSLGFPLLGDSFWQCKSPDDSSQLWSQNMQDIGVCEEPIFHDSLNIPDVDLTFLNIEEMLDGVKDPNKGLTNYEDESFFQMGYRMNLDRAANSCTKDFEDALTSSDKSCSVLKEDVDPSDKIHPFQVTDPSDKVYLLQSKRDSSRRIQQSFSFSLSRLSAESSDTECHDTGVSANTTGGEPLCNSPDFDGEQINCGENPMTGHREKKARL